MITQSALLSALAVIMLYIASVWPTGQLGLAAVASFFVAAGVIESGVRAGIYVYVVSSALAGLLLPDKAAPFLFILFFGFYPVLKLLIERIGSVPVRWILKFAVFNASLSVIWFLLRELIFASGDSFPGTILIYIGGNAIFALYDYGYSKALLLYKDRVSGRVNRR